MNQASNHDSSPAQARLLTLLFTDLVGSVALKQRLGDAAAAEVIARHYALVRRFTSENGGREILSAGDGFFITFDTPSQAVNFALEIQSAHGSDLQLPRVRIGIHMGEVTEKPTSPGSSKAADVEGLAVDLAARMQGLALPGQILLSLGTFDNARQRIKQGHMEGQLVWCSHGRYLFKGHDQPFEVYEVGLSGLAPLSPPPTGDKAQRISEEGEGPAGWRPAPGVELPHRTNWVLDRKLGEGGFGEVWVAQQKKTQEQRVFKFCYAMDRLGALKREVTLFRLLKESLGDRDDIVRILDWQFDEPPFYLELDYVAGGTLLDWSVAQGGLHQVPLSTRVDIVTQVTHAIGAAHSVGILHKDIKPSNILVMGEASDRPRIRVIDFGIGLVADRELLVQKGITALGLTEVGSGSAMSGTQLYMAPETAEGKQVTTRSDIFSLGVLLYQMVCGEFSRALATGWERDIDDELLREDIGACVDGNPERRLGSAIQLAQRLENLEERRAEREREKAEVSAAAETRAAAARSQRRLRWLLGISLLGFALTLAISYVAFQENQRAGMERTLRRVEETAKTEALRQRLRAETLTQEALDQKQAAVAAQGLADVARRSAEAEQYFSGIGFADSFVRVGRIQKATEILLTKIPAEMRNWEWGRLLALCAPEEMTLVRYEIPAGASHAAFSPDGESIVTGDRAGMIAVYDSRSGRKLREAKLHDKMIWTAVFSPDGKRILATSSDQTASICDAATLKKQVILRGHNEILRGGAFSPDGSKVITTSQDRTARIHDANTGGLLQVLRTPSAAIYDAQFSPDGTLVATSSLGDSTARIWDAATAREKLLLTSHTQNILSVAFSPDGKTLATAATDRKARLFDTATGALLMEFDNKTSWLHCVAFSPDGQILATSDEDGLCKLWEVSTGNVVARVQAEPQMYKVSFSPGGNRLLTTCPTAVKSWNVGRLLGRSNRLTSTPGAVATSGSLIRKRVLALPMERKRTWPDHDRIWNVPSGRTDVEAGGNRFQVSSYYSVFSPDDSIRIEINFDTSRAVAKESSSGRTLAALGEGTVYDAAFSPDGRLAVLGLYSNGVAIYQVSDWKLISTLPATPSTQAIYSVRFSSDGSLLAVGAMNGWVRIYETNGWKLKSELQAHVRPVLQSRFSPDGRWLATGSTDFKAKLFDVASGDQLTTYSGHDSYVYDLEFSRDGSRLITGSYDDTAKLWETRTGREIMDVFSLTGEETMLACGFFPDGTSAYAIASDGSIRTANTVPWKMEDYPGDASVPLMKRLELLKRSVMTSGTVSISDIAW